MNKSFIDNINPEEQTCEDCFSILSETQIECLLSLARVISIEILCYPLPDTPNSDQETPQLIQIIENISGLTVQ
ncbi:MAG TPA: hypothetical protein VK250_01480 [Nitrososphaeraceae archaeon]|nr:hypothetical protein [Nitrososphaeraceae archaeon]